MATPAPSPKLRGFYGGTFDPIHQGHLQSALFVQQYCQLDSLDLLPCHLPPHRDSPSSSLHRAEMVRLAIAPYPQLQLNLLELSRHTPSYTVDTLEQLQRQYPGDILCFVIGMDSLAYLTRWHRWREILALCHLLVLARPGYSSADGDAPVLLQQFGAASFAQLKHSGCGHILLLPNPPVDASATAIRSGQAPAALQISAVQAYIRQHGLYPK
jgi:nicotinate-nucleotide adenylyltransferase